MDVLERQEVETQGRELVSHLLPEVGSLWSHIAWINSDCAGAWSVEQVGGPAAEFHEAIVLRRCGGRRQTVEVGVLLWPSGWVPVETGSE